MLDLMLTLDEDGINAYETFENIKQTYFTVTGKVMPRPTFKDQFRK